MTKEEIPEFDYKKNPLKQTLPEFDEDIPPGAKQRGTLPTALSYLQLFYSDELFGKVNHTI